LITEREVLKPGNNDPELEIPTRNVQFVIVSFRKRNGGLHLDSMGKNLNANGGKKRRFRDTARGDGELLGENR